MKRFERGKTFRGGIALKMLGVGLLAVAILLSGCGRGGVSPDGESVPEDAAASRVESSVSSARGEPEIPGQAMQMVNAYELRCGGIDTPSEGMPFDAIIGIGFFYLYDSGALPQYLDDDGIDTYRAVYGDLADAAAFLYAGELAPMDEDTRSLTVYYALTSWDLSYGLTPVSVRETGGGGLQLAFTRSRGGKPLAEVSYTFEQVAAESVPSLLEQSFRQGEPYYRLTEVRNKQPLLNPALRTVEISTAEELIQTAEDINENGALRIGNTYLLTADLDFTGLSLPPIGLNDVVLDRDSPIDFSQRGFNGIFDGQGHTIRNLRITLPSEAFRELMPGVGLFSHIGKAGVVQNLRLENAVVMPSNPSAGYSGLLAGSCEGKIRNCHVAGSVAGGNSVGGLVGLLVDDDKDMERLDNNTAAMVTGCTAAAEVLGSTSVGGMIGSADGGTVENCKASGTLTAVSDELNAANYAMEPPFMIGGFVGMGFFTRFIGCEGDVSLRIQSTGSWIGAFAGGMYQSNAVSCTYSEAKAGKWEAIDVIDDRHATDYTGYDVSAE